MTRSKAGEILSVIIPALIALLIINFVYGIIPTALKGLPVFLPLLFCPIGMMLALISYRGSQNRWSKIGIILNSIIFLFPFIWMVGGSILFGV
ncbi:hypothetical protein [Bacillus atrophaeus]|uniref:hypothetical protein n=1 Tax=Bacillus atrophaeus TaxID=1452 RepID=UPI00227F270F|nr:hypothetical protein [Bacillus atrophaeus]MCY9205943.1 hypothetical protein [Bacillus atrophaeus]MEC0886899.1 hypothetical protein [Bacillus atrophaeus]